MKIILIRGLPGSGKTTMAKEYAAQGYVHCEADHFFERDGEYHYDATQIRMAHADCVRRVMRALDEGRSVVVSNTFSQRWEMLPYQQLAGEYDAELRIIEAKGTWQNVHGVPEEAIERMRARWEWEEE